MGFGFTNWGQHQRQPSHIALLTYLLPLGNEAHGSVNLGVIVHYPFYDALTASIGETRGGRVPLQIPRRY